MLKGIHRQWKQAVAFAFSKGPIKAKDLKPLLVSKIGFEVMATVCDQGGSNQAVINSLLRDTDEYCKKKNIENTFDGFLIDDVDIIVLYDVPHLFKGLRNNLLSKDLHFQMNACWDHIEKFYLLDKTESTRLCPKLSDGHIYAAKLNKMKVSVTTQVFSHSVGELNKYTKTDYDLPLAAEDTADFILFIDELFDSLNCNTKTAPDGKPLRGGVSLTSGHEEFWLKALEILKSMKLQYILPRAINQDCLENFFASLRGHGRFDSMPDASQFIVSFKALLVNKFLSTHSPGANCENDFTVGASDNLRCFL
ncbi:uncharacterized protein BDFB_011654, partial [Asbolus verrucosus]